MHKNNQDPLENYEFINGLKTLIDLVCQDAGLTYIRFNYEGRHNYDSREFAGSIKEEEFEIL